MNLGKNRPIALYTPEHHGDVASECAQKLVFKVITYLFVRETTMNGSTIKVKEKSEI